jgi:hypothetical protein
MAHRLMIGVVCVMIYRFARLMYQAMLRDGLFTGFRMPNQGIFYPRGVPMAHKLRFTILIVMIGPLLVAR